MLVHGMVARHPIGARAASGHTHTHTHARQTLTACCTPRPPAPPSSGASDCAAALAGAGAPCRRRSSPAPSLQSCMGWHCVGWGGQRCRCGHSCPGASPGALLRRLRGCPPSHGSAASQQPRKWALPARQPPHPPPECSCWHQSCCCCCCWRCGRLRLCAYEAQRCCPPALLLAAPPPQPAHAATAVRQRAAARRREGAARAHPHQSLLVLRRCPAGASRAWRAAPTAR